MIPGSKKKAFNFNDLMMIVALGRKHLRLIMLLSCFCCSGCLFYAVFARSVYYSRAHVEIDTSALPLDSEQVFHDSAINVVMAMLTSPQMLERTASRLGVKAAAAEVTEKLVKKITITRTAYDTLEVQVWAYSRPFALKWCEAMVDEFLRAREDQRVKYRESVVKSFNQEMSQISGKLENSIAEKFEYQVEKNVTGTLIKLNQLKDLPSELVKLKKRIAEFQRIADAIEDPNMGTIEKLSLISSTKSQMQVNVGQMVRPDAGVEAKADDKGVQTSPSLIVLPSMTDSPSAWEALEKEERRLQNALKEAALIYLPGHKKMTDLKKELESVSRAIDLEYEVAKDRFDIQYQDLKNQEKDLEAKLPEYQSLTKKQEKIAQESLLYTDGQLAWNKMYSDMAKQVKTLDWTANKERVNLQFLDVTECPLAPVSPQPIRLLLLALVGGLALSVGVPFLIESLDHTVSSIEEVESTFQIRGLGIIPQISSVEQERPVLLGSDNGDRNLVENFRVVRTNLLSIGSRSNEPRVIMITSSMPKEGKTVVSSNLALSFSTMGAKTLLLDTDLRRGRLHRLFGLRKGPGLSELLFEKATMEEACRPSGKEGLTIMTSGQHVDAGAEMMGTPRFAEIMSELRKRFDRIIIDTPPVLGLSETSIIQAHSDGVLFVIWGGHTPTRNMKVAVESLQANGANIYGFILNRLDLTATTNYYQYYYYSNDYYHNYHAIENA